ncbi:MAG: serine/threonine protein phosphatase, partial [Clostridia bacterium]|nr:serine/threonine protein phosphatase [Clostridia bacterium]
MNWFNLRKRKKEIFPLPVTSSQRTLQNFWQNDNTNEFKLYESLKENIPIINAAISKIIRLIGEFEIKSDDEVLTKELNRFTENVKVNSMGIGIQSFLTIYLEQLLTYGTSVAEMIVNEKEFEFVALYNTNLNNIELRLSDNPLCAEILLKDEFGIPAKYVDGKYILTTALNPKGSVLYGESILKGLPFISDILMKIYKSIGKNWDRVGDIRFAVTYKPDKDTNQRAFSRQRALNIAKEWSKVMSPSNAVNDFVALGDVDIKVIGADNPILDSSVPVKQLIEQIVSKLGIPPFLLGLSWNTTERMSAQQADILTSELDYYRRILNPVIKKICNTYMMLNGMSGEYKVVWDYINLQDETELANVRLSNAKAEKIELENKREKE